MSHLLVVEVRRALHRRLVWALLALALLAIVVAGVVEFLASRDLDLVVLRGAGHQDPAVMTDWWISGSTDGPLAVGALLLVMGALVGGASVAGAEWRAGTVTTVLTWEPRRVRLNLARTAAKECRDGGLAIRVNGVMPNVDAWYDAFGVKEGDKMYVAPDKRVRIW
jgi:hypothetical protein